VEPRLGFARDARRAVVTGTVILLHVLTAFVFGAGYVGTNVLTEVARRTDDVVFRRHALRLSGVFDRWLNQTGGTFAGITGLLAIFVFGYSVQVPWVLGSILLYVAIVGNGILFWGRVGRNVDRALAAGEEERVTLLLRSSRNVAVSRVENIGFVVLIALMVLRPGS
jgi:uncharacterized membrane protein